MFEPFPVICSACQGKLLVKNEKLVGRTVPCPRCNAPIQLAPPQRIRIHPTSAPADSHAITKVAEPDWDQALQDALASSLPPPVANASDPAPLSDETRFKEDEEFRLAPLEESRREFQELAAIQPVPNLQRPSPIPNPKAKSPNQSWLIIGSIALISTVVAVVGFIIFVQWNQKGRPNKPAQVALQSDPNPPQAKTEGSEKPTENPSEDPPAQPNPENVNGAELPKTPPATEPPTPHTDPANPPTPSEKAPPTSPTDTKPTMGETSPPNPNTPVPSSNPPSPENASSPQKDPTVSPDGDSELPAIFRELSGGGNFSRQADTEPTIEVQQPEEPEVLEIDDVYHPPAGKPVDLAKVLDLKIQRIAWRDRPLADVLSGLSLLGGVGISLDLESFIASAMSPMTPVTYESQEASFDVVLTSLLESFGLAYREESDGLLRVFVPDPLIASHLPNSWSLEDLTGANPEVWDALLRKVMKEEATLWQLEGNQIVWQPTATPRQQFRLAIVLDRIRHAMKLPLQGRYREEDLQMGWDDLRAAMKRLSQSCQSIVPHQQPAYQLLANAAREIEMRLLVDWPIVWQHGFSLEASHLSITRNRRFDQVFRILQDRYALEATIIHPELLWLTVPEVRRQNYQIRVIPTNGQDEKTLLEKLRILSPTDADRRVSLVVAPIPNQDLALVRITAPTIAECQELLESLGQP